MIVSLARALSILLVASLALPAAAAPLTRLSAEVIAEFARTWLTERLGPDGDGLRIELVAQPRDLVLPGDGHVTTAASVQAGSLAGGPVTVLVEATLTDPSGTRTSRSTTVALRLNVDQDVVVALRELPRRAIVAARDLRVERRPADRVPRGAVADLRDAIGREITRPVGPGEVLTASALTTAVVMRRGAVITLRLDGPGFRINARGVASEDGAIGQSIRVVNQTSRRELVGRVEDERTVRIPF
jgi:flagella basal body P-ring formation protein FlgA